MKLYPIILMLIVVVFIAGCSQTVKPTGTTVTTNNQGGQDYNPGTTTDTQTTTPTDTQTTTPPVTQTTPPVTEPTTPSGISASTLSAHNSKDDCWIAYKGKVYDITKWLPIHPGGAGRITPYCGTSSQFESAFTRQHGTSQVGRLIQQGKYMGDLQ